MQSWSIEDSTDALHYLPQLLLVFVAFVTPWFTTFFFEFKVGSKLRTTQKKLTYNPIAYINFYCEYAKQA